MDKLNVANFLYEQRIANEKSMENPEGELLALQGLFHDINALGYDFHYLADIDLRPIKDIRIMRLLWKYLPQIESYFTIETFIRKIDPKKIPDVIDFAINLFREFSPSNKMHLTGFDEVISKGNKTEAYYSKIEYLLNNGDSYATLWQTRKAIGKHCPEKLAPYTHLYSQGVLLPLTLHDCIFYLDHETTIFLEHYLDISQSELTKIIGQYDYKTNSYKYPLSVTVFEYWKSLCTKDYVNAETRKIIRERIKKMN